MLYGKLILNSPNFSIYKKMSDLNNGNFYLNKIFAFLKDIEDEKAFLPDNDKDLKEKEINILSKDLFKDLYNNKS